MLRVPAAGPDLSQDLIRDAYKQLAERRQWTWLMKANSFYASTYLSDGTVNTIPGSAVVTGLGTNFTSDLTGKQFRAHSLAGANYPTYTISQVVSPTGIVLDRPWIGPSLASQSYVIFQCYFQVPPDFQSFYSVINPSGNYRLNHNITQAELDSYDPQRSQSGIAYALAYYDTSKNYEGTVKPALPVHGTGSVPVSTTSVGYTYPQDSIYTVEITVGGVTGIAQFDWRQDGGTTAGTALISDPSPIDLSNGVQIYFPEGTYNLGDIFVIQCQEDAVTGVPRYELWPRPVGAPFVYPYLYIGETAALTDLSPQLPSPIARRGDVLVEMALTNLAIWPGTADQPNPYRDLGASNIHRATAEKMIYELEKKDDDIAIKDLIYQTLPFMGPWRDGSWLQQHAMYPDY